MPAPESSETSPYQIQDQRTEISLGDDIRQLNKNLHKHSFQSMADSSYAMSTCSYASPPTEPSPDIYKGGRRQYIGRKLAFWRKSHKNAGDVASSLQSASKSHERYWNDLKNAQAAMREWAEYQCPPSLLAQDTLQQQMVDIRLSQWMRSLLDTTNPIVESEKRTGEILTALAHSFGVIEKDELAVRIAVRHQSSAERKFFRSMANEWNASESQRLNQERIRLSGSVEFHAGLLRATSRKELPMRFSQLYTHYENLEREFSRALQSLEHLLSTDERQLNQHSETQSYCPSTNSTTYQSSPGIVGPLQTSNYPDLDSPRRSVPLACHEVPIASPETSVEKTIFDTKAEITRNGGLEIEGLRSEDFIWS